MFLPAQICLHFEEFTALKNVSFLFHILLNVTSINNFLLEIIVYVLLVRQINRVNIFLLKHVINILYLLLLVTATPIFLVII